MKKSINIKKLRESAGLTQQQLAEKTGIPRGRINAWEQRGSMPKADDYEKLVTVLELKRIDTNVSVNTKNTVALHTGLIEAGSNITIQDSPDYVEGFLQIDGIGPNDGSWIVSGHSMHPTISKGCRVVIRKLENLDVIVWNEIYVVDLKEHGAKIKRIKPGKKKGTYVLVSDNKEFDPFEVSLERDVLGVYRVLMVFEMF